MSLVSVRGNLIVYPLGLMWMPWLNGDAKVLAGRALRYGGFGLGVRGLLELYGGFGRARWRPQFVCVEESLWDWSFRGGLGCLMRRPCIKALASAFLAACSYTCHKASLGFSIKNKNRWVKALLNCLFVCMLFQVVAGFQMQPVFVFVGNPFWVPSHR